MLTDREYEEPPTLPPPPLWRLLLALAVILGFLYWIYQSYTPEVEAPHSYGTQPTVSRTDG